MKFGVFNFLEKTIKEKPKVSENSEKQITDIDNRFYCDHQSFASKEAFKKLRTNVLMSFSDDAQKHRCIGVTSAMPSEGKSTVSINLSYSLAELGKTVLLMDCDLRLPSIHKKLGLTGTPGLSNILRENVELDSCVQCYTSRDKSVSFDVLPSGDTVKNSSELLSSKKMLHLMNAISNNYDFLILDLPPINVVIDAATVGKNTDGLIVVLREGKSLRSFLDECVTQLKYAKIPILGFVMNGAMEGASKSYQYSYGYYNK